MLDEVRSIVRRALEEDLPDSTSDSIFDPDGRSSARIVAKASGVLAGLPFASVAFDEVDPDSILEPRVADGDRITPGDIVAIVRGQTRALLAAERTALNLLQRASGIATETRRYVDAVAGTGAMILDTRKTAPGLRVLDKYAVRIGGGQNHRMSLHDMAMIKNNHVDGAGSITTAIDRVRRANPDLAIMVEVRDLDELREAIGAGSRLILLDNMTIKELESAVSLARELAPAEGVLALEASGGITLNNVREVAETGVDRISIGALTHSVTALDISMRIDSGDDR